MAPNLRASAAEVLLTADAEAKAAAASALAVRWASGGLALAGGPVLPDRPARPSRPELLAPGRMPRRGHGSARGRFAMLHAVAHIELNAIDLAVDTAARFAPALNAQQGRAFARDWLAVAADEARHFGMVNALLRARGGGYGDLPAHDGLWEASMATADDVLARLAIVPQVMEARGLDVTPGMIARFLSVGDDEAAEVLETILSDEIGHVACGNRWFRALCTESSADPVPCFHKLVRAGFSAAVKPPFNGSARLRAGLTPDWYVGLGSDRSFVKGNES